VDSFTLVIPAKFTFNSECFVIRVKNGESIPREFFTALDKIKVPLDLYIEDIKVPMPDGKRRISSEMFTLLP